MSNGYDNRKNMYVGNVIGPWAAKHGITIQQAASIVLRDNDGRVSYRDLFSFVEHQKFAQDILETR